jgi:hypothetical protein
MRLNEVVREECRATIRQWNVPLASIRLEKRGREFTISIGVAPDNAVDVMMDDGRRRDLLIEYLIEAGVPVITVD